MVKLTPPYNPALTSLPNCKQEVSMKKLLFYCTAPQMAVWDVVPGKQLRFECYFYILGMCRLRFFNPCKLRGHCPVDEGMSYAELVKSTSLFCVTSTFDPVWDDVTML